MTTENVQFTVHFSWTVGDPDRNSSPSAQSGVSNLDDNVAGLFNFRDRSLLDLDLERSFEDDSLHRILTHDELCYQLAAKLRYPALELFLVKDARVAHTAAKQRLRLVYLWTRRLKVVMLRFPSCLGVSVWTNSFA